MNRPFTSTEYGPSYAVEEYRPDLCDLLAAEWAQQERAMPSARATRASPRARLRGLGHAASVAIAKAISGDCFYLISGAMVALDLVLVIALVRR